MKRDIVEKLPPLKREGGFISPPFKSQEAAMMDCQQDMFPGTNPHQRRHKSATARQNLYSEENPLCHRLAFNRNNCQADSDHFIPKNNKTVDWLEVHWGNDKPTSHRRWVKHDRSELEEFDSDPSDLSRPRDGTKSKSIGGTLNKSQRILCENEIWMAVEIRKKKMLLQEKLLNAAETLRNVQLRNASEDKMKEEQKGTGKAESRLYYKKKGTWDWESARDRALGGRKHEGQQEGFNKWERCAGQSSARQENRINGTHDGQKEKSREELKWESRGRQTQRTTETAEKEWRRFEERARPMRKQTTEENNTRKESAMEQQGTVLRKWEQKDCQEKDIGRANDGGTRGHEGTKLKGDIKWGTADQEKEIGRANDGGKKRHEGTKLKGDIEWGNADQEKEIGRANDRGKERHEETKLIVDIVDQHSNSAAEMYINKYAPDNTVQHLPCKICKRRFKEDRLEQHTRICEKAQKKGHFYDSKMHRAKGTDLEEFRKTNAQREEPQSKKSSWREKHQALIQCLKQSRDPKHKDFQPSAAMTFDYKTCPHCQRRFAPGPAERHIPKCLNVKSKPPPPRHHH
ncbi:peptidyl-prolyl cis-trans isomerase G [Silurus meridionalis]|uniref:C2HC/C3H-type domain-containing protein n=1 Tax=Silurus meridionalis TaxID=175797 RepID=A0A8T0BFI1_SILME|nr:peptidyl-prolyl cis-trans isomerase G [Silurus meridionalis]KAF7704607.1 hypothetical protein HF521_021679 [Silurus meridionalis]